MAIRDYIEIAAILLGLISGIGGGIAWYRGSVVKRYAAERAFGHLQKSLDQLSANVSVLADELEDLNRVAIEQKTLFQAMYGRVEAIAARMDSATSGWRRSE